MSNRFREATAINGSLLVLGQVVQCLAKRQKYIPYRDSVLTKLLETSLSGKSRTALLVCAAAELEHAGESTTTMEFAARCMRVETAPVVGATGGGAAGCVAGVGTFFHAPRSSPPVCLLTFASREFMCTIIHVVLYLQAYVLQSYLPVEHL